MPVSTKKKKAAATRKKATRGKKATSKRNSRTNSVRVKLEKERQVILDLYEHDLKVGQAAVDEASNDIVDQATNSYNRDFMFSLSDAERIRLLDIEKALALLEQGRYGACSHCEEKIPQQRLRAVPWARYCIGCQERYENGMLDDS